MDRDWFPIPYLMLAAICAMIELAVQTRLWLIRHKMERIARGLWAVQPFGWFKPGRMPQAVCILMVRSNGEVLLRIAGKLAG